MTPEEEKLIAKYAIRVEERTVYIYEGHKYERLQDALSYAEIDTRRRNANSVSQDQ